MPRYRYTKDQDMLLINLVCEQIDNGFVGKQIFKNINFKGEMKEFTSESLRARFTRVILPRLSGYKLSDNVRATLLSYGAFRRIHMKQECLNERRTITPPGFNNTAPTTLYDFHRAFKHQDKIVQTEQDDVMSIEFTDINEFRGVHNLHYDRSSECLNNSLLDQFDMKILNLINDNEEEAKGDDKNSSELSFHT
ncbi:hypothetical protein GJ496_003235, partial [Pomphorhynchus laevis]